MSGIEAEADVSRTNLADYYEPETADRLRDEAIPAMLTVGRWAGEGRLRHFKTLQLRDFHTQSFMVRHPQTGQPLCLATIQRDVTARKLHEAKMDALNRQLQHVSRRPAWRKWPATSSTTSETS